MSEGKYTKAAKGYARDVVSGKQVACKWTRLACERFLRDLQRYEKRGPWEYREKSAEAWCANIEQMPHVKGTWARNRGTITLEPWQVFVVCNVFGWQDRKSHRRRFRIVYIEVPRKNAKSTITSAVGLGMLTWDGEPGAECYSAATTRDQAKIVFNDAQAMARKAGLAEDGVHVGAHNIHVPETGSKFEPLSSDAHSLEGLNVHFGAIDELHAHKTRHVYDVIENAMGARDQPLLWNITTAGSNKAGICYETRAYATKVLSGAADDDTFFGLIYTIDDGDDWRDPKVWAKANPNLGVSVYQDDIARLAKKAEEMPSALNNFLTKRLNVWVNADTAWMPPLAWDKCADPSLKAESFAGEPCWVAADLATKVDINSVAQVFERKIDGVSHYYVFWRHYLPEDAVETSGNSQYSGWAETGRLITTQGNVVDLDQIEADIKALATTYQVKELAYDPFQATQMVLHLQADGFPVVEMRPTVLNFSEPMKQIEALILSGRLHHDGCPVAAWMVSNVVCHRDAKDNIYPRKEFPQNKIDGVVALIMALGRALVNAQTDSVYESRDLLVL